MLIEQAIAKILRDDAGVSAIVGALIFEPIIPQSNTDYPAIAFRIPDTTPDGQSIDSAQSGPPDTELVIYSVAKGVVAGVSARDQASLLNQAVRTALHGYRASVTVGAETMAVQGVFFTRYGDGYDDETNTHQYVSVFSVRYSENATN